MCLDVKSNGRKRTARKDITVYKKLVKCTNLLYVENPQDYHKKPFTAISNNQQFSGIVRLIEIPLDCRMHRRNEVYLRVEIDNIRNIDMFWVHSGITSLIVDGEETMNGYMTLFQKARVEMGKTYQSVLVRNKYFDGIQIEEGLHSYTSIPRHDNQTVIAKCIIPKGSKYYLGKSGTLESIASDTLTYVEIVE